MRALQNYSWPGNVRELANFFERLVLLIDGDTIREEHIPIEVLVPFNETFNHSESIDASGDEAFSFKKGRDRFEREMIVSVLKKVNFNQKKTAEILNIHRNTLLTKLRQYRIDVHELKKEYMKVNV